MKHESIVRALKLSSNHNNWNPLPHRNWNKHT